MTMIVRTTVKAIQDIMRQDVGVDGDAQRISQLCWMFFLKIIDDHDQELELTKEGYRSPIPKTFQWRSWAADPEGITGQAMLDFINDELFPALKELKPTGRPGDRRRVVRDVFEDAYNYMKSGQLIRQVVNKINEVDFNNLDERRHFGEFYEQLLNDLQSAGNAGEYYTPRAVTAFMVDRIEPHPGEVLFDPACGTGGFLTCAIRHMEKNYVKTPKQREKMQGALRAVEKKQLPHMLCVTNMLLHGIEDPSFVRHDNTLARPLISWGKDERVDIVLTNPPFGGLRLLKNDGRAAVVLPDGTLFGEGVKTRLKEQNACGHRSAEMPGDQSGVFRHVRMRSTHVLSKGKDVIVDAMHVEAEDRKRQSMIAPPDVGIRYVIIDRPLADKLKDAGWRAGRGIVEKYHEAFPTKVAAALDGDGRSGVRVVDLRAQDSSGRSGT